MARPSLTTSPHASDEEDDGEIVGSVPTGLTGLADEDDGETFDDVMGSEGMDVDAYGDFFDDAMGSDGVGMDADGQLAVA